uniref:Uncharacterized protein n=1 Tax=Podoviridae sp. ct8Lf7 TaxID=2827723 RepID=A0A8S5S1M1_9CAUD|nr:MAG TPA: hypothetical protein [Podoviridae sp. ct8Lf7]
MLTLLGVRPSAIISATISASASNASNYYSIASNLSSGDKLS